jgi:hypothetical protein
LGIVEIKKCYVLSGCGLEEHETSVEFGTVDAQVLSSCL